MAAAGQAAGAGAAIIVAHGQPSDPAPAAAELALFAVRVAAYLPGWRVASATLAEEGALAVAAAGLPGGVVFPLFMAGGWFARVQIPSRLAQAGLDGWQVLEPFGCDPQVQDLAVTLAAEAMAAAGIDPAEGEVILAAHGSFKSSVPSDIARHVAARIGAEAGIGRVAAGFIDQEPQLSTLRGFGAGAVCLPFFAARGGHVTDDIPAALDQAGFRGRLLPPLGLDARAPELVAKAIRLGRPVCQTVCMYKS